MDKENLDVNNPKLKDKTYEKEIKKNKNLTMGKI